MSIHPLRPGRLRGFKTEIGVAMLLALVVAAGWWRVHQNRKLGQGGRINRVSSLKQVGLAFRANHNDLGRFTVTGIPSVTNNAAPGN